MTGRSTPSPYPNDAMLTPFLLAVVCKMPRPSNTPMATDMSLSADNLHDNTTRTHMSLCTDGPVLSYQSVVGMLMWAMQDT